MLIHGQSDTLWMVHGQLLTGDYRYGGDLKSVSLPTGGSISADQLLKVSIDRRTYYPVTVKSKIAHDTYLAERITAGEWELLAIKLLELDAYNRSSYQNYYYLHRDEQTILINRTNPRDFLAVVLNDCFTKDNLPAVTYRQDDLIRVMEAYHKCKHGGEFTASRERYTLNKLKFALYYGAELANHKLEGYFENYIPEDKLRPVGFALQFFPHRTVGFKLGLTSSQYHLFSGFDFVTEKDEELNQIIRSRPGNLNYKFRALTIEPGVFWLFQLKKLKISPILSGKIGGVKNLINENKLYALEVENQLPWKRHIPEVVIVFSDPGLLYGFETGIQFDFEFCRNITLQLLPYWKQVVFKEILVVQSVYHISAFGIKAGIAVPIKQFH